MKIFYSSKFIREFKKLPKNIQDLVIEKGKVFRKDIFTPSLNAHKLHGSLKGFWSFSINHKYRIIFEFSDDKKSVCLDSVGNHDIYE